MIVCETALLAHESFGRGELSAAGETRRRLGVRR